MLLGNKLSGLGWTGLGWAGLGWAGLGWAGLDWTTSISDDNYLTKVILITLLIFFGGVRNS